MPTKTIVTHSVQVCESKPCRGSVGSIGIIEMGRRIHGRLALAPHLHPEFAARREDVLEMLRRRPCTVEDIAAGLGLHRNEVVKYVQELTDENRLDAKQVGRLTYYKAR